MIEAEITLDMRPIDTVSVTVYDSSGHSSGAHHITLEKPVKTETPTVKPTTTTPAQQDQSSNTGQKPQTSNPKQDQGGEQGEIGAGTVDRDKEQVFSDDNTYVDPSLNGVTQDLDGKENSKEQESETGLKTSNEKATGVGSIIVITIIIGIIVFSVGAIWYRVKNKKNNLNNPIR